MIAYCRKCGKSLPCPTYRLTCECGGALTFLLEGNAEALRELAKGEKAEAGRADRAWRIKKAVFIGQLMMF